ncbi:hypothetical protein [Streptococcus suis]|uniref:hypothetical protein n=1 Tax=Streptococcus suis TaxID=1307 RepID=UPI0037577CC2
MTVRGTVIFIRRLEIEIVGRRFSLHVGCPRRLEIGTAGRQFSLYLDVHEDNFWLKRLEIGTAGRQFSLYLNVRGTVIFIRRLEIEIVGRRFSLHVGCPKMLEIGTALGSFLCIQLLKDDSWLELESGGFYLKFEEGTMGKFAEFSVADSRVLDR